MKNSVFLAIAVLISFASTAQTVDLESESWDGNTVQGAYYKDINNRLNDFEGSYLFTDGTTSLKIVLVKKINSTANGVYSEDLLIGELQFINNGTEEINTLNLLPRNDPDQNFHSIRANTIISGPDNNCPDCSTSDYRIRGLYSEASTKNAALIILRKILVNGQEALKLNLDWQYRVKKQNEAVSPQPKINGYEYVLIKQ